MKNQILKIVSFGNEPERAELIADEIMDVVTNPETLAKEVALKWFEGDEKATLELTNDILTVILKLK